MIGLLWQAGWSCTNRLVPGGPVQTAALTDRCMLTLSNCYRRRPQHLGNYAAIALQVISTGAGQLLVQDPVGLAVDPVLVRLAELACLLLGGGPRLRVASMGLVGHRVLALRGQPEIGLRQGVTLCRTELGHLKPPAGLADGSAAERHRGRETGFLTSGFEAGARHVSSRSRRWPLALQASRDVNRVGAASAGWQ